VQVYEQDLSVSFPPSLTTRFGPQLHMRETWQELIVPFGELAAICLNCDMRFEIINIQGVVYIGASIVVWREAEGNGRLDTTLCTLVSWPCQGVPAMPQLQQHNKHQAPAFLAEYYILYMLTRPVRTTMSRRAAPAKMAIMLALGALGVRSILDHNVGMRHYHSTPYISINLNITSKLA
jgi:hypothetical protein